ncbi:MAG: hypothetical protein A3B37_03435 [Candidatus Sungbacteria bacterium RIFCSPLOWO2_01_FULL_59_16]|uniref:Uncharacterized protein n=1 Tax=Candidatus Sungbacteria bacterium RIFCSPLOWO2_01_FULL_59_16 TaxID=1802280 RepID=A0A1G2LC98_9BACT|nr:MAG: hypothetical protein A3B37_03435 [Candidatus Sungbacteria bacterium RIFCSPLOWO2_01_FULL_59_16]
MGRLFDSENLLGVLIWCMLWITMADTPQKGRYRWIVFRKGDEWVVAALEFNIVEVGDDPNVVYLEMQEAAKGYIEATQKLRGFRPQVVNPVLNQEPDKEYEHLWSKAQNAQQRQDAFPENVFDFGTRNLAAVM